MDQIIKYKCPKCGNTSCETGTIWAAGSLFNKLAGFENRRFTYITCSMCYFTEFYKISRKRIGEMINFRAR